MTRCLLATGLSLAAALTLSAPNIAYSQSKDTERAPIEHAKAIGRRVIANTPFKFVYSLPADGRQFDFMTHVDFGRNFGTQTPAVAYAYTCIEFPKDTMAEFDLAHSYGLTVIVNGNKAYSAETDKPFGIVPRERSIEMPYKLKISLRRGFNNIVIKQETPGGGKPWRFALQPKGALIEGSPVTPKLKFNLAGSEQVDINIAKLTNWLIVGPFANPSTGGARQGLKTNYGPEYGLEIGKTYTGIGSEVGWGMPRLEGFGALINSHPLWGTYYSYNYHAAGVAWAMANLSEQSGDPAFNNFSKEYCDFILAKKPFIGHQVDSLLNFRAPQHLQFHTPLLDFTTAPALPFAHHLIGGKSFDTQRKYKQFVDSIINYVLTQQVRLPDGTFTRETPEKYTTWVDDMFMGIPFLVHASRYTTDAKLKAKLMDEAANQVLGFNKNVYDPSMNLYMHAQYFGRKAKLPYWSRANGWGIWASSEVLKYLPKTHPQYAKVLDIYKKHVDGLVVHQDKKTGFFHQILNDPTSYNETSGTAIFTMAIARGVNNGWLPKSYRKYAQAGWNAVSSQIKEDGTVNNICVGTMSSEDPNYYKTRPVVPDDSHGLLGVLFACMEMQRLEDNKK